MIWKLLSSHTFLWLSAQCLDGSLRTTTSPFLFVLILVSSPSEHGEERHRQIGERLPVEDFTTIKSILEDTDNIVGDITGEGLVSSLDDDLGTVGLPLGVVLCKGRTSCSISSMLFRLLLCRLQDRRACLLGRHCH